MTDSTDDLRLRAYHGRENGLMIIGSVAALEKLGAQLLTASQRAADPRAPNWPPIVASPNVEGPYLNEPQFKLSFNVTRSTQLPESLSRIRRSPPLALLAPIGILALVGIAAIVEKVL